MTSEKEESSQLVFSDISHQPATKKSSSATDDDDEEPQAEETKNTGLKSSTFVFSLPTQTAAVVASAGLISSPVTSRRDDAVDEDGDLVLDRAGSSGPDLCLRLSHASASTLQDVGFQLWRGSLFLSDFLVNHLEKVSGRRALEIGAGAGLVSIVSTLCGATRTFSTDLPQILSVLERNVLENLSESARSRLYITPLDLTWPTDQLKRTVNNLGNIDTVLIADCIYDDELTRALFHFLHLLVRTRLNRELCILISIEKRIVFTVEKLRSCAPAYDYFKTLLDQFVEDSSETVSYSELGRDEIPQSFCYESSEYLVLVELSVRANK